MEKKIGFAIRMIVAAGLSCLFYVLLHETGHMIVMLMNGDSITEFDIISLRPHVRGEGGTYTDLWSMVKLAAGSGLPFTVSLLCSLFFRRNIKNTFYRIFSFVFCVSNIGSMMTWVVSPFAYVNGIADKNDDTCRFLDIFVFYHDPLRVSLTALILVVIAGILVWKRGLLRSMMEAVKTLKAQSAQR